MEYPTGAYGQNGRRKAGLVDAADDLCADGHDSSTRRKKPRLVDQGVFGDKSSLLRWAKVPQMDASLGEDVNPAPNNATGSAHNNVLPAGLSSGSQMLWDPIFSGNNVCVQGVAGAGKSTAINGIILQALCAR